MAWEFDGLFDALVPESDGGLMAAYWQSEPTAIRVGKMGYRTRTTKAGDRLEAEVYPIFGREKTAQLRQARKNLTPEKMRALNEKRSKRKLILLLEANFRAEEDIHLTLTYEKAVGLKQCKKDLAAFFRKVRRIRQERGLPELKYIYAIGHDQNSRIHAHVILNGGVDRSELERIWGKGYANGMRLQEYGSGLQGIANYLHRQNEQERARGKRQYIRAWNGSRNLKKPKERTSDSRMSCGKVKILARDFRNEAKAVMEKVYPGYTLQDCEVFYSDVVDGVYIRCVMRRWEAGG